MIKDNFFGRFRRFWVFLLMELFEILFGSAELFFNLNRMLLHYYFDSGIIWYIFKNTWNHPFLICIDYIDMPQKVMKLHAIKNQLSFKNTWLFSVTPRYMMKTANYLIADFKVNFKKIFFVEIEIFPNMYLTIQYLCNF